MPLPQHEGTLAREHSLMPQVFAGAGNDAGAADEDRRRRAAAQAAAAQQPVTVQFAGGGGLAPVQVSPPPPPTPNIIDRLHKYAGSVYGGYIYVGRDHAPDEADQIPPMNPGFRSLASSASSLNDAYQKAKAMSARLKPEARICIIVLGSLWDEDLTLDTPKIDLFGKGLPVIHGHINIPTTNNDVRLGGMRVSTGDATPSIFIAPGPLPQLPTATIDRLSPIRFYGMQADGPRTALEFYRRIYARKSIFWQTSEWDTALEICAVVGHASIDDADWSVFYKCDLRSFLTHGPLTGLPMGIQQPSGFALKATAKLSNGLYLYSAAGLTGQSATYYSLPTSGIRLVACEIDGSLLTEGWTVQHVRGNQTAGIPYPPARGGVYARMRGFVLFDPMNGAYGQVPAQTFFDHVNTRAALIAEFVPDPAQSIPYVWGGKVNYRHSMHHPAVNQAAASPFQDFATAEADIVQSATACASWTNTGVSVATYGDCPTGVQLSAMYDPYWL